MLRFLLRHYENRELLHSLLVYSVILGLYRNLTIFYKLICTVDVLFTMGPMSRNKRKFLKLHRINNSRFLYSIISLSEVG